MDGRAGNGRQGGVCGDQREHGRTGYQQRRRTEARSVLTLDVGLTEGSARRRGDDTEFARRLRDRTLAAREWRPVSSPRQPLGQNREGDDNSERKRAHGRPADRSVP